MSNTISDAGCHVPPAARGHHQVRNEWKWVASLEKTRLFLGRFAATSDHSGSREASEYQFLAESFHSTFQTVSISNSTPNNKFLSNSRDIWTWTCRLTAKTTAMMDKWISTGVCSILIPSDAISRDLILRHLIQDISTTCAKLGLPTG